MFNRNFSPNLTLAGITWRRLKIHIGGRVREANFDRVSQRDRVKVSYNFRWMQLKIAYLSLCLSVEIRPIEFYVKPCFVSPFYKISYHSNASKFEWFWIRLNERYFPGNLSICMGSHAFFVSSSKLDWNYKENNRAIALFPRLIEKSRSTGVNFEGKACKMLFKLFVL